MSTEEENTNIINVDELSDADNDALLEAFIGDDISEDESSTITDSRDIQEDEEDTTEVIEE